MRLVGGLARSVENDVGDAMYDGNLGTDTNWSRRVGRLQIERERKRWLENTPIRVDAVSHRWMKAVSFSYSQSTYQSRWSHLAF